MNAWGNLPNAKYIDCVLADVQKRPEEWIAAWGTAWDVARDAARGAAWDAAWDAARDVARGAAWDAAWDAVCGAAWDVARGAAWDAACGAAWGAAAALVAFDYAGDIMQMPPDAVRLLKASGDPAAAMLLPAVIVHNQQLGNQS